MIARVHKTILKLAGNYTMTNNLVPDFFLKKKKELLKLHDTCSPLANSMPKW